MSTAASEAFECLDTLTTPFKDYDSMYRIVQSTFLNYPNRFMAEPDTALAAILTDLNLIPGLVTRYGCAPAAAAGMNHFYIQLFTRLHGVLALFHIYNNLRDSLAAAGYSGGSGLKLEFTSVAYYNNDETPHYTNAVMLSATMDRWLPLKGRFLRMLHEAVRTQLPEDLRALHEPLIQN